VLCCGVNPVFPPNGELNAELLETDPNEGGFGAPLLATAPYAGGLGDPKGELGCCITEEKEGALF